MFADLHGKFDGFVRPAEPKFSPKRKIEQIRVQCLELKMDKTPEPRRHSAHSRICRKSKTSQ